MLISTMTSRLAKAFGDKEALRIIKETGYDCADMTLDGSDGIDRVTSPDRISWAKDLKKYADSIGIFYNQAHAPFAFPFEKSENFKTEIVPIIVNTFDVCSALGVDTVIVHPLHHISYKNNREKLREMNMEYYNILRPYAENCGVRICLENMFQRDPETQRRIESVCCFDGGFIDYFDSLGSDTFTCCLDIGHCGLVGTSAQDAIRMLGHDRIGALHVHDNDLVTDQHLAIGMGKVNWDEVAKALADIDYKGIFTLEADCAFNFVQKEFMPLMAKYMYESAKAVTDKIEAYKNAQNNE